MKNKAYILIALAILLGTGAAVYWRQRLPQAEGVCRLKTVSSVDYLYTYDVVHFFWALDKEPQLLSGVPDNVNGQTTFYSVPFKSRDLSCCLFDAGENTYTLYADLNGNGSLADEKPLKARRENYPDDGLIYLFGPLSLTDDATAAPFYLFFTNFTGGIHLAPVTVKTGNIRINNSVHQVMLADLDFDNRYISRFSPACLLKDAGGATLCDRLLFDLDGDKHFMNRSFNRMECMPLCSLIKMENLFYQVDIVADTLTASPVTPPAGTLKLNTADSSLMLYSDTYCCFLEASKTVELPEGQYTVAYAQNSFADAQGVIWTCQSKRQSNMAETFSIARGFPTWLCFPASFRLKTSAVFERSVCRIGIELMDDSGTVYTGVLQKNYDTADKPKINICDSTGKIIHTGTMEYG